MKPKHIITIITLLTAFLVLFAFLAPTAAAESPVEIIIDKVRNIIEDTELNPSEKLEQQTKVFGMDLRLKLWLEAPRDEETGEPIYDNYIPVISPVLSYFGLSDAIENPYTQEEGQAAYDRYLEKFTAFYQPTGTFGGPIS